LSVLVFSLKNSGKKMMAEIRETYVKKTEAGNTHSATPWLAFLVGALLIGVVAIFLINGRAHLSGPAGSVDVNLKSPVTITAPATPAR
jgi:hypothetical protein